jgi:photosystem II stability/assembly factor-like uncharacterized protein
MAHVLKNTKKQVKAARLFAAFALCAGIFSGCLLEGAASDSLETSGQGQVKFAFEWTRPETALMKSASADTMFSLDSVLLIFTAPGAPTQTYRYPFTGRADLENLYGESPVFDLAPLRNWKAKIISIDMSDNPTRRDTVHFDSASFAVKAGDTALVNMTVRPVYSILRARFLSTTPDSIPAGIRFLRLRVNGVTRDSIALSGGDYANTAVFFPSITTGWMANDAGKLMKSTDSGNTWTSQENPAGVKMNALWFNSTSVGWAVGEGGAIVKSNGSSWTEQESGLITRLNGVMFTSNSRGYAVGDGGRVLKTLDGGSNWALISGGWYPVSSGTSNKINSLAFSGATGWLAADDGVIRKSIDGGRNWSSQSSGAGTTDLRGVHAVSSTFAVAVGDGGVIRRTTNGSSWTSGSNSSTANLRDVYFANATYGWAVGEGGAIRRSGDGGATWSTQGSGVSTRLNSVNSNGSNRVLAVGDNGEVRRRSSISNTDAFTDASNNVIGSRQLNSVFLLNGTNTAWVAGNGGFIAKATNSANDNWTRQGENVTQENLQEIYFLDANEGWAVGENGVILVTTDGGSNWTKQTSGTSQHLYALQSIAGDSVVAGGAAGTVARTRNAGMAAITTQNLNAVYFKGDTGYVVGDAGVSLRTSNGGASWSAMTGSTRNLYATFISPSGNNVYAVGAQGTYMTSSNAYFSSSWDVRSSGTSQALRAVWVSATEPGPASIYAAGDNGVIRVRNDGSLGDLDEGVNTGTTETLWGLQCYDETNNCWAVGGGEMVLRTRTASVSGWTQKSGGAKTFNELLAYKYLKPGQANTVLIQAIDRASPLRGYQSSLTLTLGAGQDSTLTTGLSRCGYGGPACTQ